MAAALLNYGLLFIGIIILIWIVNLGRKYPLFGWVLTALKNIFLYGFMILYGLIIIFACSFLAGLYIAVITLLVQEPHFFFNGERLDVFMEEHESAALRFSAVYGILYFVSSTAATLLLAPMNMNVWMKKGLSLLATAAATVIFYPILINSLFKDLHVSFMGGVLLLVFIGVVMIKQLIRREFRSAERQGSFHYLYYRLIPWLKKGSPPDNEPYRS